MYAWKLPQTLQVGKETYRIRTDFRPALDIIAAFNDIELPQEGKMKVLLEILYIDMPPIECLDEAVSKATWFLDCGKENDGKIRPQTMDWEQDAPIIFPAINKLAGYETRAPQVHTHWWTFVGYFNEIYDGFFSQVLAIRQKRAKGKKLDKWELEFLKENKEIVELRRKLSDEEKKKQIAEQEAVDALFRN